MKKSTIFLVFLLISPFFAISSYGVPTPTEPNLAKDFVQATSYATSNQSVTEFGETLPNDVLFYPDSLLSNSFAFEGSAIPSSTHGTYLLTHTKDLDYFEASAGTPIAIYLNFSIDCTPNSLSAIELNSYPLSNENASIDVYNGSSWETLDYFTAATWHNVTIPINHISSSIVQIRYYYSSAILCMVDYAEIVYEYLTLADSDHYAESFADVSDWTAHSGGTVSSDGDVATIIADWDGGTDSDGIKTNEPSIAAGSYVEIRAYSNVTGGGVTRLRVYSLDNLAGSSTYRNIGAGDWGTYKFYVEHAIESIYIQKEMTTGDAEINVDYLRVCPSDEMGWQHDFSTTAGISSPDGGTIATDGDLVTLTADGDGSTFIIVADTTATATAISTTYYPFFSIRADSWSASWTLEQYDGSAYATLLESSDMVTAPERRNMASLDTYVYWWRFTLPNHAVFILDWIKAYSIANFTVFEIDDEGVSDTLYVTDTFLYCSSVTQDIIKLGNDLTLNITTPYHLFSASLPTGDDDNFRFRELADTYQYHDTGVIFEELYSTELTDYEFMFYGEAIMGALYFLEQLPEWHNIVEAEFIIYIPLDQGAIDALLVFVGLAMVPFSTCFLVYGGRKNMSLDKMLFFIIMFMVGWGLILGGVM